MGIRMDKFVARSGREVKPRENGSVMFDLGWGFLTREAAFDAEEYFQAKRDEELGRWRVPQDPHLVVYESPAGVAFVFDEKAGDYQSFTRDQAFAIDGLAYRRAARAYFEAHPERKPWHDAKVGEVWILTHIKGETGAFIVDRDRFESPSWSLTLNAESITDGRRIWPEDAS